VQQKGSDSGLELEYVNSLQWQANPNATGVVGYFVYRDGAKIATLNASTLRYEDHNRKRGVSLLYTVTSFNADGMESNSVSVTIK
jgi:hypothetical protein